MNRKLLALGLALSALLFLRRSNDDPLEYLYHGDSGLWWDYNDSGLWDYMNDSGDNLSSSYETRLKSFLRLITIAETGSRAVNNGTNYRTFYGGSLFNDLTDHPTITGEKTGVRLPDSWCRRAGFSPGCVSTAAGAYQINRPTWVEFRENNMLGPRLPDFSPASQDEAARRILARVGALDAIARGDFDEALRLASTRWASLPGSTAGQPTISRDTAVAIINEGMGLYA